MEYLDEDRLKLLLHKEWLVKSDSTKSTSYLFKFYSSTVDQCCCVMITDTKNVWGEVITSNQIARRWRECNPGVVTPLLLDEDEEDEWRTRVIELLTSAHSLGAIADLSFEIVESRNADLAFEVRADEFKWRWDTYSLGPKTSADVISQHLIIPLISVNHMAFSSAGAVGEQDVGELEKAVDKVGRTARRTMDTHVKHAISKPRVATSLHRMTAVFNFLPDLPSIFSEAEAPELKLPEVKSKSRAVPKLAESSRAASIRPAHRSVSPVPARNPPSVSAEIPDIKPPAEDSSATEPDTDAEAPPPTRDKGKAVAYSPGPNSKVSPQYTPGSPQVPSTSKNGEPSSEASSPVRPPKKAKRAQASSSDSDEDSEAERKRRIARLKNPSVRGAKQPIKRGAKRF